MILLRGHRGLAFDRWLVRWTGLSLMSLQYALAGGNRYMPVLLLTTIGSRSGNLRTVVLPYLEWRGRYVAIGEERKELFQFVTGRKPNVARYQERASDYGRARCRWLFSQPAIVSPGCHAGSPGKNRQQAVNPARNSLIRQHPDDLAERACRAARSRKWGWHGRSGAVPASGNMEP